MTLRVLCVGERAGVLALERSISTGGAASMPLRIVGGTLPEQPIDPAALEGCDAVCLLNPVPEATWLACAAAGRAVLAAGPPAATADLAAIGGAFERSGSPLVVRSPLAHDARVAAARDALQQGRVGAPVYLRYVSERHAGAAGNSTAGDPTAGVREWHIAGALQVATELLGEVTEVYAAGIRGTSHASRAGAFPDHLSLSLGFADGSSALVGMGTGDGDGDGEATVLLVGDQGVVETAPLATGVVLRDVNSSGDGARPALPLREGEALAAWLVDGAARLGHERAADTTAGSLARARALLAALEAVRVSLASGQPAGVGAQ